MKIVKTTLPSVEYFPIERKKTQIVLHHTVSASGKGVSAWFASDKGKSRVAVAFVVDKDGTIYQLFEPKYWAYHIGKGSTQRNNENSIGIEIVNEGSLTKKGNDFYWFDGKNKYEGKAVKLDKPFRGVEYFASYTNEQVQAVKELLAYLLQEFPLIHKEFSNTFEYSPSWLTFNGVVMHVNLREDKTDLSPAFPISEIPKVFENFNVPKQQDIYIVPEISNIDLVPKPIEKLDADKSI